MSIADAATLGFLISLLSGVVTEPSAPAEAKRDDARADTSPIEPGTAKGPSNVWVRVDPSVPDAETMVGWVEDRAHAVLDARETPLEDVDVIRIKVEGVPYDYRVTLVLLRRSSALPKERQPRLIAEGSQGASSTG